MALPRPNASAAGALSVAVLAALALAGPVSAHVSVRPSLLPSGVETTLAIELPSLRPGYQPTSLAVSGPGVRELSSRRVGRLGEETRWRVRIRVDTQPGPLALVLDARFADGRSVPILQTLTVVPGTAERDSGGAPVAPVAAGFAALVLGTLALLYFKRKSRPAC